MSARAAIGGPLLFLLLALAGHASAQSKNLAPGFAALALGSKVAIMPTDIELFPSARAACSSPRPTGPKPRRATSRTPSSKEEERASSTWWKYRRRTPTSSRTSMRCTERSRARSRCITWPGFLNLPTKEGARLVARRSDAHDQEGDRCRVRLYLGARWQLQRAHRDR